MVWPVDVWHGISHDLADMACYMITPDEAWYVEMLMWISCFITLPWAMVPFTCGEADVSWRSCLHVQDPFTSRVTVTCMFRSHVQLLFTLGSDSKLRDCEYIYHLQTFPQCLPCHTSFHSSNQAFVWLCRAQTVWRFTETDLGNCGPWSFRLESFRSRFSVFSAQCRILLSQCSPIVRSFGPLVYFAVLL